jgi:protein-S-isoprenylcysteine O-methyltransferase Ste14
MRSRRAAALGSALFLVVAPGVVAGVIPWLLTGWDVQGTSSWWLPVRALGVVLLVAGIAVLLLAFARFVREGIGTPAPVAPTQHLVVGGLYRYVRNVMYLAVLATIVGQALLLAQLSLLLYAGLFLVVVAAFVRWYEEPTLLRQFGPEYERYRREVPGWWPRLHPPRRAEESTPN